jgi:hypothetical protein
MSNLKKTLALLMVVASLSGCATLINGHAQNLAVTTDPPGASCTVYRGADVIGTIGSTPAVIGVARSRQALTITCVKTGYSQTLASESAHFSVAGAANLPFLPFSIFAEPVDLATGANFYYPDTNVVLQTRTDSRADSSNCVTAH